MKLYEGTCLKKDGSLRTMKFVKTGDLPKSFLARVTKGGNGPKLDEGFESVWDVENAGFRIFNHNTLQGELTALEVSEDILNVNR